MKYTIESPVYIGQSVWAKHRRRWRKYEVYSIVINAGNSYSQFYHNVAKRPTIKIVG